VGLSPFTPNAEADWEIVATSTSAGTAQSGKNATGLGAVLYSEQNDNVLGKSCPAGNGQNSVAIPNTYRVSGFACRFSEMSDRQTKKMIAELGQVAT
jgi:hypothetical protein